MQTLVTPDLTLTAVQSFGLRHPAPVKKLLDCAARLSTATGEQPGWEGVYDPEKVVSTVQDQVRYTLGSGQALREAVATAQSKIAARLATEVSGNLSYYTNQLEEEFDEAASEYAEAVVALPREFTADDITQWDSDTFEAYTRAKHAYAMLNRAKEWMMNLARVVPGESYRSGLDPLFIIIEPGSLDRYAAIQTSTSHHPDNAYKAVGPVALKAVKDGATLRLALPSEAMASSAAYEQQRQEMDAFAWRKLLADTESY